MLMKTNKVESYRANMSVVALRRFLLEGAGPRYRYQNKEKAPNTIFKYDNFTSSYLLYMCLPFLLSLHITKKMVCLPIGSITMHNLVVHHTVKSKY